MKEVEQMKIVVTLHEGQQIEGVSVPDVVSKMATLDFNYEPDERFPKQTYMEAVRDRAAQLGKRIAASEELDFLISITRANLIERLEFIGTGESPDDIVFGRTYEDAG